MFFDVVVSWKEVKKVERKVECFVDWVLLCKIVWVLLKMKGLEVINVRVFVCYGMVMFIGYVLDSE